MKNRKPNGYWKIKNNVLAEARKLMEENNLNTFPGARKLIELGYFNLSVAINKYHDGFHKFREILGEEQLKLENGLWKDLDYCIEYTNKFLEEHPKFDTLPSTNKLKEFGYSNLVSAIQRYHGNFRKFREILGEEQLKLENGLWKDLDYCIKQAEEIMEENNLNAFPGARKLRELGYSSLSKAINEYHKGFPAFRAKLNEHLGIKNVSDTERLEAVVDGFLER